MFLICVQNQLTGRLKYHRSNMPTERLAIDETFRVMFLPEFYCLFSVKYIPTTKEN